jgi:pimeloyl-ACP methyl ester carboxylesterase
MKTGQGEQQNFIEISGDRLHFLWLSPDLDATPLVFLHEGLGSVELWRDFPAEVVQKSGHPGLLFSRSGHGLSDPLIGPRAPDFMHVEALKALPEIIESLVDGPPILVGHSDGASIALIYAGSGFQVEGLILIAPHVFVEPVGVERIAAARRSFPGSDMPAKMARYHSEPVKTFNGWADVWLSPEFQNWNIEEYLPNITCPTLLIQSIDDEYGSLDQLDAIEAGLPGEVERLEVPGTSHSPHLSHRIPVTAATADFLSRLDGERR